jgi:hypothetical protein
VLLFAALAVAFFLPPEQLLMDPPWLRYLLAAVVAFAPVFLANLIFTFSFRDTKIADMAFASNLLGAMLGGVIEYAALITGYRALLIAVAVPVRSGLAVRHPLPGPGGRRPERPKQSRSRPGRGIVGGGHRDELTAAERRRTDRELAAPGAASSARTTGP